MKNSLDSSTLHYGPISLINNMAGEACMHQIEDEPVHEVYSSLVGSTTTNSSRQTQTNDVSHTAYAAASLTISASYHNHNPPTLIIKGDKDESSSEFTSSSTFMNFYRGSCRSISEKQPTPPNPPPLAYSKNVPSKKSESSGQAAANKIMSTKSTRLERRQQAKRERDKQIQQERRIRTMLNSDLSEEDEALYTCFHR